jgi:hypothetical protein
MGTTYLLRTIPPLPTSGKIMNLHESVYGYLLNFTVSVSMSFTPQILDCGHFSALGEVSLF